MARPGPTRLGSVRLRVEQLPGEGTAAACALLSLLCISRPSNDGKSGRGRTLSRLALTCVRLVHALEHTRKSGPEVCLFFVSGACTHIKKENYAHYFLFSGFHPPPHHRCQRPHPLHRHNRMAEITSPSSNGGRKRKVAL